MATAIICDKCGKILHYSDSQVKIDYVVKREDRLFPHTKKVNLCANCYKEIFGDQLEEFLGEEDD